MGTIRHIVWSHVSSKIEKVPRGIQAFYSRNNAFMDMKMTLHLIKTTIYEKKGTLCVWHHFLRTITLAVFDIPAVLTESQVLY